MFFLGLPNDARIFQDYRAYCSGTMITPNHMLLAGHCGFKIDHPETKDYRPIDLGDVRSGEVIMRTYDYSGELHDVTAAGRFVTLDPSFEPVVEAGSMYPFSLPHGYKYQDFHCYPEHSIWYTTNWGYGGEDGNARYDFLILWCGSERDTPYGDGAYPAGSAPGLVHGALELQSNCDGLPGCQENPSYCCDPQHPIVTGDNYLNIFGIDQVGEIAGTGQNSLIVPDPYDDNTPHYRSNTASYLFFRRPDGSGVIDPSIGDYLFNNLFICHGFSGSSMVRLRGIETWDEESTRILGVATRYSEYYDLGNDICIYTRNDDHGIVKNTSLSKLFGGTDPHDPYDDEMDTDLDPKDGIIDFLNDYFIPGRTIHFVDRNGAGGRWFVKAGFAPWMRYYWKERGLNGNGRAVITAPVSISLDELGLRESEPLRIGLKATSGRGTLVLRVVNSTGGEIAANDWPLDPSGVRAAVMVPVGGDRAWIDIIPRDFDPNEGVAIEDLSIVEEGYEWAFDNVEERSSWKGGVEYVEPPRTIFNEKGMAGQVFSGSPLWNGTMNVVGGHAYVLDFFARHDGAAAVRGTVSIKGRDAGTADFTYAFDVPGGKGWTHQRKFIDDLLALTDDWVFSRVSFEAEIGAKYYVEAVSLRSADAGVPPEPTYPFCRVGDGDPQDPDRDNLRSDGGCDNCPDVRNEDQFDSDFDGLGDACDVCPNRYDPDRQFDGDGDGVGDACDNCLNTSTADQANCNYSSEENNHLDPRGDKCDPDPCVSLCDPIAPDGRCVYYPDRETYAFLSQREGPGCGMIEGEKAYLPHWNHGFKTVQWPPHYSPLDVGKEEALQLYWCSCWDIDEGGWLDESNCRDQCAHDGTENANRTLYTGWFGTIRQEADFSSPAYDDIYEIYESPPEVVTYSKNPLVEEWDVFWRHHQLKYPAAPSGYSGPYDPLTLNELKFWFRPLNRYSLPEKKPPKSAVMGPEPPEDWNNTYTPVQELHYGATGLPIAIMGVICDVIRGGNGHTGFPIGDDPTRHPGMAKLEKMLERFAPWFIGWGCPNPPECPFLPPQVTFQTASPDMAYAGLVLVGFSPFDRRIVSVFPSRGAAGEVPSRRDMALAMMRMPSEAQVLEDRLFAFGGADAQGNLSALLLEGRPGVDQEGTQVFTWHSVETAGQASPAPRSGASMLSSPGGYELLLFAGEGDSGLLSDLWSLKPVARADGGPVTFGTTWTWQEIAPSGDVPSPRSNISIASIDDFMVFYGGMTASGPSSEIFLYYFDSNSFLRIDPAAGPGPGARTGASIQYSAAQNAVYLFGGEEAGAAHNDLWKMDLGSRSWSLVLADCARGTCPPVGSGSHLVVDSMTGAMTLFPRQVGITGDLFYFPREGGWEGQKEIEGAYGRGDCDGDGLKDERYGMLCSTGESWWSPPGLVTCDSFTGGALCNIGHVEGEQVGSVKVRALEGFEAAGSILWAAGDRALTGIDVSVPDSPEVISSIAMPGRVRAVETGAGYAYVAADREVVVVNVADPFGPVIESRAAVCGSARSLSLDGETLAVASSSGVGVIDVTNPRQPLPGGWLWVIPVGGKSGDGGMAQCESLARWEQVLLDLLGAAGGFGSSMDMEKDAIFIGSNKYLYSIDASDHGSLQVVQRLRMPGRIEALRLFDDYLYLNLAS